jgi:hypothetical protein
MRAAQVALAILTGILIASAAALFIADENAPAWVFSAFGLFGYFCLLAMIVSDARPGRFPPPPP